MGITKTLTNWNNENRNVSYWRISGVNIVKDTPFVDISILGYTNKTDRDAGYKPITHANISLSGDDFPLGISAQEVEGKNTYNLAYAKIHDSANTGTARVHKYGSFDLHDGTPDS